jgi:hypothetical protein
MRILLVTNARDELNIKEWACHHLLLGFDYILIIDHKSKIPIRNQFHNFDNRIIVQNCNLDGPIKLKLMQYAVNRAKQNKFDWLLYLDADEFLVLNQFQTIKQLLHYFRNVHSISIPWLMFGSNNHRRNPDGGIIDNYTRSDPTIDQHVKTIVRPQFVTNITNPHFYHCFKNAITVTVDKQFISGPFQNSRVEFSKSPAFIAHYVNQSEETYISRKINLPTDDTNTFRSNEKKKTSYPEIHSQYNAIENNTVCIKYSEGIKQFLEFKKQGH